MTTTVWCWVVDVTTGHRYDIPLQRLDRLEAIGAVREVPGRRRRATDPRRPKRFVDLAGRPSVPRRIARAIRPAEFEGE